MAFSYWAVGRKFGPVEKLGGLEVWEVLGGVFVNLDIKNYSMSKKRKISIFNIVMQDFSSKRQTLIYTPNTLRKILG